MKTITVSNERKLTAVADRNHMVFLPVGIGGMIQEPIYINEWWFEKYTNQPIPLAAARILEEIKKAGVEIQGVIYAHEAPKLLAAPKKPDFKMPDFSGILLPLGVVASLLFMIPTMLQTLVFMMMLAVVDPALIVVLPSGQWVMVMSWLE